MLVYRPAMTKYHKLNGLNNRNNSFSHVKANKKIKNARNNGPKMDSKQRLNCSFNLSQECSNKFGVLPTHLLRNSQLVSVVTDCPTLTSLSYFLEDVEVLNSIALQLNSTFPALSSCRWSGHLLLNSFYSFDALEKDTKWL